MLTILYPENDFTSADIAIRTQALAKGQGRNIYVVPKHFGRVEANVHKNLAKTTSALFIAFDAQNLDESTKKELEFLTKKGVVVHALIPDKMTIKLLDNFKPYRFSKTNKENFEEAVKRFSENLKSDSPAKNSNNDGLIMVGILLLTILFLGLIPDGKK